MKTLQNTNAWLPAIFEDFLKDGGIDASHTKSVANRVNILENGSDFTLEILAPGFTKKSFSIELEKNSLVVSGAVEALDTSKEKDSPKFTRKEFMVRDFKRSFTLPETIDVEAIKASYKNGILSVILPKMEEVAAVKKMVEIS
ncbi:MAG: HSP20 family protein [Saprospiraceae bacterium]|jgi:HSP20 family protein|uniref:Hsp20/alpha crystallin family protein n=1 Tax=Patiriisocius sp. Uisw_047 TaxID=3230969 RepID=UPI0039ED4882